MALYGLQGMNSEHDEVKMLLKTLPRLINTCKVTFDNQAVSNTLYGNKIYLFVIFMILYLFILISNNLLIYYI
jgi:hypothetical protein